MNTHIKRKHHNFYWHEEGVGFLVVYQGRLSDFDRIRPCVHAICVLGIIHPSGTSIQMVCRRPVAGIVG